jgi:hypothetical protein
MEIVEPIRAGERGAVGNRAVDDHVEAKMRTG